MMPLPWMDIREVPFQALLLLERVQLGWFPHWNFPEPEMSLALRANPVVAWYLSAKNREIAAWVGQELARAEAEVARLGAEPSPETIRSCESAALETMVDLLVYAIDPAAYDAQPFLDWDSRELTGMTSLCGKTVIDVGAGTGRLAFAAATAARVVYAVEPVENLRRYMREKARRQGFGNVFPVDGTITEIPFPDSFADLTMGGHVFGDDPAGEFAELMRVTKPGGMLILCPGNNDEDNDRHCFLVEQGCQWSVFEEPRDGKKRKYWMLKES